MEVFLKNHADASPANSEKGMEHLFKRHALVSAINAYPNYFIFTFVRNPYERFISAWKHSIRAYSSDTSSYFYRKEKNISLKEYAYLVRERNRARLSGFDWYHSLPQTRFIPDFNTKMFGIELEQNRTCNFIGRFENLEQDFAKVCSSLRMKTHGLPKYMVSPEKESGLFIKHYRAYYDLEILRVVEDIYREDFTKLGYSYALESVTQRLSPRERVTLSSKMAMGDIRKGLKKVTMKVQSFLQ